MGFAFPKEDREAALDTYPDKFLRPTPTDMRFQWLVVRLDAIDEDELRELVFDAWRMVVPKKLAVLSDDELQQRSGRAALEVSHRAGLLETEAAEDRR